MLLLFHLQPMVEFDIQNNKGIEGKCKHSHVAITLQMHWTSKESKKSEALPCRSTDSLVWIKIDSARDLEWKQISLHRE
jgi:hypothetical protein